MRWGSATSRNAARATSLRTPVSHAWTHTISTSRRNRHGRSSSPASHPDSWDSTTHSRTRGRYMPPQATNNDPNATGVNVVPRSTGERALGAFNAATSGAVGLDSHGTPLDDAINAHHQARLDQAR